MGFNSAFRGLTDKRAKSFILASFVFYGKNGEQNIIVHI